MPSQIVVIACRTSLRAGGQLLVLDGTLTIGLVDVFLLLLTAAMALSTETAILVFVMSLTSTSAFLTLVYLGNDGF